TRSDRDWSSDVCSSDLNRLLGAAAIGSLLAAGATSPAAAKLNSCDGPIVLGTTISLTGINSTLAGRWDKLTDAFEKEFNKTGGRSEERRVGKEGRREWG